MSHRYFELQENEPAFYCEDLRTLDGAATAQNIPDISTSATISAENLSAYQIQSETPLETDESFQKHK